ncbi:MAG TPA: molybdopterin-dependent oxidoreductase [Thermoanaerobaculia bacterium]
MDRTVITSACPLDCPDACSLEITVEDGRVTKLDGDRRNPETQGFICNKVRRFHERLYGPDRLLHPGVRAGGKGEGRFRRASWDEALDLVAAKLEEARSRHGGESILPFCYGGSNGLLTQDAADARLFHRLGASWLARTVCAATSGRACSGLYGGMPGVGYQDYVHARLIVLWGANPSVSGIHLVPYVLEARRRGAKLVVVDPRRTPLARQADLHLAVRPGADLPLALAVIRWLFAAGRADLEFLAAHAAGTGELRRRAEPWTPERAAAAAGVPAADIEAFARLYADAAPAVVRCGWGVERNRHGGSAVAAVLALPAVAGKLGVRGGGYTLSNAESWSLDTSAAVGAEPPPVRTLNMNRLGRHLTEPLAPPVSLLFVYNSNPLATLPNQRRVRAGLAREDLFTVVFDPVLTDTARYADVVLPATTFLEHGELRAGYGAPVLQRGRPVVAPAGEARSNHEVFLELCRRLGLQRPGDAETLDDFVRAAVSGLENAGEVLAALDSEGIAVPASGLHPVQMVDLTPGTADGRIHLCPEELDREAPGGLYRFEDEAERIEADGGPYPLALLSPAGSRTICSTLGELDRRGPVLELHPDDARRYGIAAGDAVRAHNEWGEVRAVARLSPDLRPGVTLLEKGMWLRNAPARSTVNALIPDHLSDLAGGACFSDARVAVERIGGGSLEHQEGGEDQGGGGSP